MGPRLEVQSPPAVPPPIRVVPPRIGREYHPPSFRWCGLWAKGGRTLHVGPWAPAQDDASQPSCPEWTVEIFRVATTASPARLLLWEVTLTALRTLPKSGKQRVRGHVTSPTPVATPPPCPKVGRRWRPRSVSQSKERVSLGDLSGRPWRGKGEIGRVVGRPCGRGVGGSDQSCLSSN